MPLIGAFIVPHPPLAIPRIGRGQEKAIQKTLDAYREVAQRIAEFKPNTILITTPHAILYEDYIHISPGHRAKGDFRDFGMPDVGMDVTYDAQFVQVLECIVKQEGIPAGTAGERERKLDHGTMVPLFFVNQLDVDYELVRISLSGLAPLMHYRFGKCIKQAAEESEKRIVFIASGDLSHRLKEDGPYGFAKEGPEFDREVTNAIARGDFLRFLTFDEKFTEAAAECGLRSFIMMAGALDGRRVKPELLSYEGPYGVGYAVASFEIGIEDENRQFDRSYEQSREKHLESIKASEDACVRLARQSLECYVRANRRMQRPKDLPDDMISRRAGVFVSLKRNGRLRGCIGTISPTTECIADEIIQNAVAAGAKDPRFSPVNEEELSHLVYSVDVLSEPEPIESKKELDVKEYGVIVSHKNRRGLLLPNIEGVDTPKEQVSIALQKAGIASYERYTMERFRVVRHT